VTIKKQITSGLKWSALSKGTSQLVSWVITIYVIRLLAPGDYGLMAMVSVVIAFLSTFNEFGLGSALVQSKKLNNEEIGAVYGAMLLLGAALSVLLALVSPLIAIFFNEPRLQLLIAVAGLQFLLNAATIVPESMMRRDMTFKPLSMADLTGAIAGSLGTLALAVNHYGVWSLVLGNLAGASIRSAILITLNPRRVSPHLRLRGAKSFLSYGSYMTGAKFVAYFMSQADVLIGAKLLGKEALGLYTVSLQLASLPVDKAMSTVNQVAFSAISRMQDQRHEMQQALLKAIRLLAYLMLPLIYGLASVAPEFIPIALGPNWGGAVLPLQIVAVVIPLRMITAFYATAIYGVGRADLGFKNTLVGAAILPLCFYVGAQWGAVGLAAGWLVGTPTVFLFNFRRSRDALGISFRQLFGALAKPFLSALCMVLALMVIRSALSETLQPWITLLLLIGVGAIAYGLAAFALDSQLRKEVIAIPQIQRLIKGF
jgi:O-antigen/teichoic acid export membrane protein